MMLKRNSLSQAFDQTKLYVDNTIFKHPFEYRRAKGSPWQEFHRSEGFYWKHKIRVSTARQKRPAYVSVHIGCYEYRVFTMGLMGS